MFRLVLVFVCVGWLSSYPNSAAAAAGDDSMICVNDSAVCCPRLHTEDGRAFYHCELSAEQAIAASYCNEAGGALARVTSSTINAAVTPPAGGAVWVDGTDAALENEWRYSDGTAVGFTNWQDMEPDGGALENCLHVLDDGLFRDVPCDVPLEFICETAVEGRCGDGEVDDGEECDDGNVSNQDACLNSCVNASCGDGFRYRGIEECDDGDAVDTDACRNDCTARDAPPAPRAGSERRSGGCAVGLVGERSVSLEALSLLVLAFVRRPTHNRSL